ncbi:MAG: fimbria major subunit [Muribaculaceae bacterium]|nr:fimbria major subunit [Muribaculaceae bacterium]
MSIKSNIFRCLSGMLLSAPVILLTGCDNGPYGVVPGVTDKEDGEITIVIHMPLSESVSRANPEGGEDGNGREDGILNENSLHDLNFFFYNANSINPDGADNIKPVKVFMYTDTATIKTDTYPMEAKYTITIPLSATGLDESELLAPDASVSFITVANAGVMADIPTLADLRRHIVEASVSRPAASFSAADYDRFVMTTAYNADRAGVINIDGQDRHVGASTLTKKEVDGKFVYQGETTIQRLCARVDLMYKQENDNKNELLYNVAVTGAKVHITHIAPVNFMTEPSYLLTKTTTAIPVSWSSEDDLGTIKWAGVETCTDNKVPTNYVIEPHTLLKEGNVSPETLSKWFGESRTFNVGNELEKLTSTDSRWAVGSYFSGEIAQSLAGTQYDRTLIVGYPDENVQSPGSSDSRFVTGLAFRAVYQPSKLSAYNKGGELRTTDDSDIHWSNRLSHTFTRYMPTTTDGITDDKAIYFSDRNDALAYAEDHPEDQATITVFPDGVCYYNLWLHHYDDIDDQTPSDPHAHLPMEYAIVRNNIYRVSVSFNGPGDPTPDMREPETMKARIFVRKWNKRAEKDPLDF